VHARTFTLAESHEMAGRGHQILFKDGQPDVTALGNMHDDGFFADITSEDTLVETPWSAMDRGRSRPLRADPGLRPGTGRATRHLAHHSR